MGLICHGGFMDFLSALIIKVILGLFQLDKISW